jgi:tetratricopeptide (TPR) repeat protein
MREAIDYLRRAFALNPKDCDTVLYLSRAYEETGDYKTALLLYQELRKLRPDDDSLYYNLGMNFGRTQNQAESHYNFGIFYQKKNKHDSAVFHFQQALKFLPPDDPRIAEIQKSLESLKKDRKQAPAAKKRLEF